jgi:hypothetical protein
MNFAYSMWNDDDLEYHRVFYPWTEDPDCVVEEGAAQHPP